MRFPPTGIALGLALLLAACAPRAQVPEALLDQLPPEAVDELTERQHEIVRLERELVDQRNRARQAALQAEAMALEVQATERRLEVERELTRAAMQRGDREEARQHQLRRTRLHTDLEEIRSRHALADVDHRIADAQVGLTETRLEHRRALLEHEQARALAEAGFDVDPTPFRTRLDRLERPLMEQARQLRALQDERRMLARQVEGARQR